MDNKDIELIQQMENNYDNFMPALTNLIDSVEKFNSIYNNYIELNNFYGSEKWFEYMEIEKIPVKCGVLSEDQLYDMIGEHNELLGALLDLTSKMYKNFLQKNILRLVVKKSPTGESTHYFFHSQDDKVEVSC